MDKSLHDLVENYATIAWKNATQAARTIGRGASRRGLFWAAGVVSRVSTQFWRNFGVILNQLVQRVVHPQYVCYLAVGCAACIRLFLG